LLSFPTRRSSDLIYRIKKKGTREKKDPWGTKIQFAELTLNETANYLDDERPMVRKKALESLIQHGSAASDILISRLNSDEESVRLEAIYALHRIGTVKGNEQVRSGLKDASDAVRIVAARLTGLAKDQKAVSTLMKIVRSDSSVAVRRQAATALGQIGDPKSVTALIDATKDADDHFLVHSIRYALITMNQPDDL